MLNPEQQRQSWASLRFTRALKDISTTRTPEINEVATTTLNKIRTGRLRHTFSSSHTPCPSLTDFSPLRVPSENPYRYLPFFVIDPDKIVDANPNVLQADVVRTIAI